MPHHRVLFKIIQGSLGAQSIYFRIPRWNIYCFELYLQNGATASILSQISSAIKNEIVYASSDILSLSPFLDESGLMRVGGRLKNSNLTFNACYPILLPRKHILTQRIIKHEHTRNLHAGLQATMAFVSVFGYRSTVRGIIQKCVTCFRAKSNQSETLMGSLPASRVNVSKSFSRYGVERATLVTWRKASKRTESQGICFAFCVLRHEDGPSRVNKWPYVRSLYYF